MRAAPEGKREVAQALVAAGADVNRRNGFGRSAAVMASAAVAAFLCRLPQAEPSAHIVAASLLGDAERVRDFIARGANVRERGEDNATCLALAAQRGHLEVVRVLLEAGAAVDAVDSVGHTALMRTALEGQLEVVQALVAAGADVNNRDANNRSAAVWAAIREADAVAAFLCRLPQAEPSAHIVAASMVGDLERVRDFIARCANVYERGLDGATCLALAAQRGHLEVVRVLLQAGAGVHAFDDRGISVLDYGVGQPAILAALLQRFVVGGRSWHQGQLNSALGKAVSINKPEGEEGARLLLGAGADADVRVSRPPPGVPISLLSWAAERGRVAAFRLLLEAGADVRGMDREATPEEEVRQWCRKPEAVPGLLAALADAAAGGGGGGGAAAAQ